MFSFIYHTFIYNPIYNLLIALAAIVSGGDVGVAIILLTVVIKIVLYPLSQKAVLAQKAMRDIEPHVQKVRKEVKDSTEQFKQLQALYKEHKVNPFSSFGLLFIQIPILYALFFVVRDIKIVPAILYAFTPLPAALNAVFLGVLDITKPNLIITILVVVTQFILAQFMSPAPKNPPVGGEPKKEKTFQEEFARSLSVQTKYILPLFIGFISYSLASAISLYWITNNVFSIGQEWWAKQNKKQ